MSDFEYDYDSLEVQDDGHVTGSAYVVREDGYSVDIGVTSYEYNDEGDLNHVPGAVVSDENGVILAEPHAHDTDNPEKAIERARNTGQNAFENLDDYIDE